MTHRAGLVVVLVLILCLIGPGTVRADEIDVSGSWQTSLDCGGGVTAILFVAVTEDPATGALTVTVPSDCGTVFLDGAIHRFASCSTTPSPLEGQVSGTTFSVPPAGFWVLDYAFEVPFPSATAGCVDPTLAGFVDQQLRLDGMIDSHAAGTATRIDGCLRLGSIRGVNTQGATCFSTDSGGACVCDIALLRNDVAVGANQTVEPLDGATVTFSTVDAPGTVSVTPLTEPDGELPANFQLLATPIFYDVATTATVSGLITVCLPYPDADDDGVVDNTSPPINENDLQIFHREEGGVFVDRTLSRDTATNTICAEVASLSQFVLGATEDLDRDGVPDDVFIVA